MKKFKTPYNYEPESGVIFEDRTDLTVPNQELNITELRRRIEAGIAIPKFNPEYNYDPHTFIPQMRIKDLTDLDAARQYISSVKSKFDEAKRKNDEFMRNDKAAAEKKRLAEADKAEAAKS